MENSIQPAFAVSKEMAEMSEITEYPYGLTKREYFAAKALQGLMTTLIPLDNNQSCPNLDNVKYCVNMAVTAADELLSALAKQTDV